MFDRVLNTPLNTITQRSVQQKLPYSLFLSHLPKKRPSLISASTLKSKAILSAPLSKERPGSNQRQKSSMFLNKRPGGFQIKSEILSILKILYQTRKSNERCFFFMHIYIYIQKLNQKSIFTKMSLFEFLISLSSYVSLFLSSIVTY